VEELESGQTLTARLGPQFDATNGGGITPWVPEACMAAFHVEEGVVLRSTITGFDGDPGCLPGNGPTTYSAQVSLEQLPNTNRKGGHVFNENYRYRFAESGCEGQLIIDVDSDSFSLPTGSWNGEGQPPGSVSFIFSSAGGEMCPPSCSASFAADVSVEK
jgi:hypothetical protein